MISLRGSVDWMVVATVIAGATLGCGRDSQRDRTPQIGETETEGEAPGSAEPAMIPPETRAGDTVGGLEVVSANLNRAAGQPGVWVGEVRFRGTIEVTGERRLHPSDPELDAVCFFPDSLSGLRLPRLRADERTAWFCFRDGDAASAVPLGAAASSAQTIEIEDYTYHFSFSDVFNTARLVSAAGNPAR